jgi:hypothetical protein
MTDEAEQSIPSRGSHGVAIAWGIRFWDGTLHGEVFQTFEAADKHLNPPHSPLRREDVTAKVVPLFVSPTLTDEEREAVEYLLLGGCEGPEDKEAAVRNVVRRLLERTK